MGNIYKHLAFLLIITPLYSKKPFHSINSFLKMNLDDSPQSFDYTFLIPKKKEGESSFRRAEIIFFIALPFAILYSSGVTRLANRNGNLTYSDKRLFGKGNAKFFFVNHARFFIIINCILWSGNIAFNDFYENLEPDNRESFITAMDGYRMDLNFFRVDY